MRFRISTRTRSENPGGKLHDVRHAADGGASQHAARDLRVGDAVWVAGPFGDAWLRPEHDGPILAIAGGTGLAPIKSIVGSALRHRPERPMHLYFGARDEPDIYLEPYFRRLAAACPALRYVPVLSAPRSKVGRRIGLVTEAVAEDFVSFAGMKAYVSGPPAMVAAATKLLSSRGLAPSDIHADSSGRAYAVAPPSGSELRTT